MTLEDLTLIKYSIKLPDDRIIKAMSLNQIKKNYSFDDTPTEQFNGDEFPPEWEQLDIYKKCVLRTSITNNFCNKKIKLTNNILTFGGHQDFVSDFEFILKDKNDISKIEGISLRDCNSYSIKYLDAIYSEEESKFTFPVSKENPISIRFWFETSIYIHIKNGAKIDDIDHEINYKAYFIYKMTFPKFDSYQETLVYLPLNNKKVLFFCKPGVFHTAFQIEEYNKEDIFIINRNFSK